MNKWFLLWLIIFILFQTVSAQVEKINIECVLTISETEWSKDSKVTARLMVRNNSDKEVKIYLPPHFSLDKQSAGKDSKEKFGNEFTSKEKEEDNIITKRTKKWVFYKIKQFFTFSLKSGESRTVEFDLSKLAWNHSMSSILIDYDWFSKIPSGDYNLYYHWSYKTNKDKKGSPSVEIFSNKIGVKLNSEK